LDEIIVFQWDDFAFDFRSKYADLLLQINEAFAPQTLACQKELGVDMEKLNTNGGAIAVGHPVGASGSRISAHLTHKMRLYWFRVYINYCSVIY